jgi:hypothetical protein
MQGLSDNWPLNGESARKWAFDDQSMEFTWSQTRGYQYNALTTKQKEGRDHYWALTLFGVGSIIHLLEDMGVPEHVRNDFKYGQVRECRFTGLSTQGLLDPIFRSGSMNDLKSISSPFMVLQYLINHRIKVARGGAGVPLNGAYLPSDAHMDE